MDDGTCRTIKSQYQQTSIANLIRHRGGDTYHTYFWRLMMIYKMIQKVGDRDNPSLSIKDIAFTINANPMSDRLQKVIEVYEEEILRSEQEQGQEGKDSKAKV